MFVSKLTLRVNKYSQEFQTKIDSLTEEMNRQRQRAMMPKEIQRIRQNY